MKFEYVPKNVCSRHYTLDIEDNKIRSLQVEGGCQGNLGGISRIVVGMDVDDVIKAFEGVDCHGRGTSCPDQISRALKAYKAQAN
ncbi:MAG: TIGR03905 family TSCPD domain-containing protein [Erysipelotrichaceae bacterium]|nr:TIGR03905 family TSCPD domain-containing protein [Erysipelotrichaceae bacterium]MBQ6216361.1 TIGR03905 family TSCPD domain-containing protein [Erysipelotrichaceae bacterium]